MIREAVQRFLEANNIRGPLIVAVSGGPDSTALLLALVDLYVGPRPAAVGPPGAAALHIVVGHVNHHLRGADSDADAAFVADLCRRLGVPLHVADGTLDPEMVRRHGVEAAAREIRRARLQKIRAAVGATHIATAHQKNDQAETVLMRLMTGSGLAGLRGIHPLRADGVVRPLLEVSRQEIDAFLRERSVTPQIDRSNADPRFLRNRIRALLSQFAPQVIENLAAVARQAFVQWEVMERLLDRVDSGVQSGRETRFPSFPDDRWLRQALLHRHIQRLDAAAREVSAADLERLAGQLDTLDRVSVTRSLEILRRRGEWILRQKPQPAEPFEIELKAGETTYVRQIGATIRIVPTIVPGSSSGEESSPLIRRSATFSPQAGRRASNGDPSPRQEEERNSTESPPPGEVGRGCREAAGEGQTFATQIIQLPPGSEAHFTIRSRRDGDRFQPLGMQRQKKLKDFLIDRKIPAEVRDRLPLLVWHGTIACVGGVEISEAFKITGGGELYEIAIEKNQEGIQ